MIDKVFGAALKGLRAERNLSQEELSFRVGLHRTYISQLERGLKSPSLRTLQKICLALNIPLTKMVQTIEYELRTKGKLNSKK